MHASASEPAPTSPRIPALGFDAVAPRRTSAKIVRDLQRGWQEIADRF